MVLLSYESTSFIWLLEVCLWEVSLLRVAMAFSYVSVEQENEK